MAVNFRKKELPLTLDLGGCKVSWCRITDGTRTWEDCELPAALPPHSFILVKAGKLR